MAPNGQARAHILHPMHTLSLSWTDRLSKVMAFTGHTFSQGASSQLRHCNGIVPKVVWITCRRG